MTRKYISDYIRSLLMAEICNRCPICGNFEKTGYSFTNHHINHDNSVSEYWNLIRTCQKCHKGIEKNKDDGKRDRKIKQIKKDLFRRLIGAASYEFLLLTHKYNEYATIPVLAIPLLKLDLVNYAYDYMKEGDSGEKFQINYYSITKDGKKIIRELNLK